MRVRSLAAVLTATLAGFWLTAAAAQSTDEAGAKADTTRYSIFGFGDEDEGPEPVEAAPGQATIEKQAPKTLSPKVPESRKPDTAGSHGDKVEKVETRRYSIFGFGDDEDVKDQQAPAPSGPLQEAPAPPDGALRENKLADEANPRLVPYGTGDGKADKVETRRYSIFDFGEDEDEASRRAAQELPAARRSSPLNLLPGEPWLPEAGPAGEPRLPDLRLQPAKPDKIWPTSPSLARPAPQFPAPAEVARPNPPVGPIEETSPPAVPAAAGGTAADEERVVALPPGAVDPLAAEGEGSRPGDAKSGTKRLGDALDELMQQNPVVARVDGRPIHWADVINSARDLPNQYQSQVEAIFPALLDRLIDLQLLSGAARQAGLSEDEELRRRVRAFEERLLRETYLKRQLADRLTTETLRARYDRIAADVAARHEVRARHIQLESEAEAAWVIEQLDQGADFVWLAKRHSTSASAARGGDLGYFDPSRMPPGFSAAAYALAEGDYSRTPVETAFGWHVIELIDRRANDMPSFFQLRDQLRDDLAREIVAELVNRLRGEADLQMFPEEGLAGEAAEGEAKSLFDVSN